MKNQITRNRITLFRTEGATFDRSTATGHAKKEIENRALKSVYRTFKILDDVGNECYITFIGSKRELK